MLDDDVDVAVACLHFVANFSDRSACSALRFDASISVEPKATRRRRREDTLIQARMRALKRGNDDSDIEGRRRGEGDVVMIS